MFRPPVPTSAFCREPPRPASYSTFAKSIRDDPGSAWLAETHLFRSIGACYDDENPQRYWYEIPLTAEFDVLIHFESTGPTTVLPFRYPESW